EPTVRSAAAQALTRVARASEVEVPDEAIATVVEALRTAPLGNRYASAMALNELAVVVKSRAAAAGPPLIDTLRARDWEVRCAALASLSHIGPPSGSAARDLIQVLLQDKSADVRRGAALALAKIGPEPTKAVKALTQALRDRDASVRQAAA